MQQIIDRGRFPLNDASKKRYADADLLNYANSAVFRAYELRPDLMFGTSYAGFTSLALGGTFPLPDRFVQTVADYITGRAETRDDESVVSQRAVQLLGLYEQELLK